MLDVGNEAENGRLLTIWGEWSFPNSCAEDKSNSRRAVGTYAKWWWSLCCELKLDCGFENRPLNRLYHSIRPFAYSELGVRLPKFSKFPLSFNQNKLDKRASHIRANWQKYRLSRRYPVLLISNIKGNRRERQKHGFFHYHLPEKHCVSPIILNDTGYLIIRLPFPRSHSY
jgi:hypothetical protein